MHVVIGGCGRVGSQLAVELDQKGHTVVIIDKNPDSFRRIDDGFGGQRLTGFVFDRPTLEHAGIRRAQAFVAVTSGDNSNIVSARAAKDHFKVRTVVARIYDPDRAAIYERLGITTIATARWTADAITRLLLPEGNRIEGTVGSGAGDVVLVTLTVPSGVHAVDASALNEPGRCVLVGITRQGSTHLPPGNAVLESDDVVHLAVDRAHVERAAQRLAGLVEGGR